MGKSRTKPIQSPPGSVYMRLYVSSASRQLNPELMVRRFSTVSARFRESVAAKVRPGKKPSTGRAVSAI